MTFLINKADGENRQRAEQARLEQQAALSFLQPATPGWKTQAALCSARTGEGVPEVWQRIERFFPRTGTEGRHRQTPSTTDRGLARRFDS